MVWCYGSSHLEQYTLTSRLPGAIGMLITALAIRNVRTDLPDLVYAMLSGLNSAIVGIVAHAGLELAGRAVINRMTLVILCASGSVAMLYRGTIQFFLPGLR